MLHLMPAFALSDGKSRRETIDLDHRKHIRARFCALCQVKVRCASRRPRHGNE